MSFNKMNNRISIKKRNSNIIDGRPNYTYSDFYECWAEILDIYGAELYQTINLKLENVIIFKVRYSLKLKELREKENFKVVFENLKYDIYYVDFMNNNKKDIKIKCKLVI